MKKMLISGASGFLGGKIAEYYKDKYEIMIPTHAQMDITSRDSVAAMFLIERPDVVIHCAAISDTKRCEAEPDYSAKVNVAGSMHVAAVAAQYGAKAILCSSDQVYCGNRGNKPHREDEMVFPYNQYGKQKRSAEKECMRVNPEAVLLRLSWMYNPDDLEVRKRMDFPRILMERLEHKEELKYPYHDVRGITDVNEVVKNMEVAMELPGGVYNFGAANDLNTYEMVENLLECLGLGDVFVRADMQAFASLPRNITMDATRMNENGIVFSNTLDGLCRCLHGKIRKD